jgi:hypothetical protein
LAKRLGRLLLDNYPDALEKDSINVILVYGYDIGIAAKWTNQRYNFVPDEFHEGAI